MRSECISTESLAIKAYTERLNTNDEVANTTRQTSKRIIQLYKTNMEYTDVHVSISRSKRECNHKFPSKQKHANKKSQILANQLTGLFDQKNPLRKVLPILTEHKVHYNGNSLW